ncbi:IS21-like element helper ATPase IstB [Fusibacter sp. 3D3]|uniref:IS21-like element helper ATPase IstB n=1 Tax=Fusibacter sp. 3D3 TaxID=1048380 RepID=UPI000853246E|nr:IS21-like element helper ATPase IstB [Fusibacter sp. 3D3]GAU77712.1 mobile element protein [Fusibacter sp. 3D3]
MQQLVIENKTDYIEAMMKKFKLVDVREQYSELIDEAETASMGYLDFLVRLLSVEEEGKKSRRYERLLDKACFESTSKLEEIDYDFNPTIDRDKIEELGSLRFMEANENIIVIGPPGVGKSMIATGIGRNACKNGHRVLFVNAKALVDRLHDEMLKGTLPETLENINKIDLLIVDELSYISMDKERESLFFQIIRQRYEKRSLIITTNLPMGRWNELFTGQLAATAILDRLLHHLLIYT